MLSFPFFSFTKRSSCRQKDKVKGAVCSNVIGVVERSHYSDKNRKKNSTLLTFTVSHLFSLWSIWVFGFQLINLSACSFSVHLPLSDHFISLSTFFFPPSGLLLPLVFTLQPFHVFSCVLPFSNVGYFILPSPTMMYSSPFIPFSYGWWGPGMAESVSSHGPRPLPLSPGHRISRNPSSPLDEDKPRQDNKT